MKCDQLLPKTAQQFYPNPIAIDRKAGGLIMSVFARRTRVVSFRISDQEYEELMDLCAMRQARSLSDFARLATLGQSQGHISNSQTDGTVRDLYRQLRVLDREVKRLAGLVEPQQSHALFTVDQIDPAHAEDR